MNAFLFGDGMATREEILREIPDAGRLPTSPKELELFLDWVPSPLLLSPTGEMELEYNFVPNHLSHEAMAQGHTLVKRYFV